MTNKELQTKWFAQELRDRFSIIWDSSVLADEKRYAISDMVDAGFSKEMASEMVEDAILDTRE